MKELFQINDHTANKVSYYLILLLLSSLPFDRFYSHLILIGLLIHTLIHVQKKHIKPIITWPNLALASIFLVTAISTIYSNDKVTGYHEIGKQAFILLIPLLFCLNPIDLNKYRHQFFLVFSIASSLYVVYLYLQAVVTIWHYHLPLSALFSAAFTSHNFSEPFAIHATYFSMQLSLALLYLLSIVLKGPISKFKLLLICCCGILLAGILQLGSKSIFIALLVIINFAIPYFLLHSKKRIFYMGITITLTALLFIMINNTTSLNARYLTEFKKDLSTTATKNLTEPRLMRWQVAMEVISSAPLFGHGAGSETELLRTRYFEKKFYRSYLASLNAHNEFLSMWIKAGIFGLLVYLVTLAFGLRTSITNNDFLFFGFLILIIVVSFSENILDVDKGIVFYSFFFSLLYFSTRAQT